MKEFFGFGGYQRPAEGYFSWQHLLFVTVCVSIMAVLAVVMGLANHKKTLAQKNKAMIIAAILIDSAELFKIIILCWRGNDPMGWVYNLPLFLCSIQLITIPLAAFSKGRMKEASLDFVCIFGLLGAVLGILLSLTAKHQSDLLIQIEHHILNEHGKIVLGIVDPVAPVLKISGKYDPAELFDDVNDHIPVRMAEQVHLVNIPPAIIICQDLIHDPLDAAFNAVHCQFLLLFRKE